MNDDEIFLCHTDPNKNGTNAWFTVQNVPAALIDRYKYPKDPTNIINEEPIDNFESNRREFFDEATCKTDKAKVNSCDLKTRTCGIQVLCSNCGIILGFKELSESRTQVASMLVDFKQEFVGIFNISSL